MMRSGLIGLCLCGLLLAPALDAAPKSKAKGREAREEKRAQASEQAAMQMVKSLKGTIEHIDGDPSQPVGAVVLQGTALTAAQIRQLADFKQLDTLILRDGPTSNETLAQLSLLTSLRALDLENTAVNDAGLASLTRMPNLQEVYLTGSGVTAKGVEAIRAQLPTTDVYWLPPLPQLKTAAAYFKLGEELNEKNERVQAIRAYTAAMQLDAKFPDPYLSRGWTLLKENEPTLANADFTNYLKMKPDHPRALGGLALSQYLLGDSPKALTTAEKALKLDKACVDGLYVRGMIRFDENEFARALPDLEKTVELEPSDPGHHERLGWNYFELKNYEAALTSFDVAVRLDPTFEHAYYGRGLYWLAQKDANKAIADLSKAFELDPEFPDYAVDLALAYATKGDWAAAVAIQKKVLAIASEEDQAEQKRRLQMYAAKQLPKSRRDVEAASKPGTATK